MKKVMTAVAAIMLTVTLFFATGCNKENNDSDVRVTTYTPQDITQTTAKCGGDAIVTQGLSLSEFGVCWSKERNPTAEGYHLSTATWNEPYVCTITGLEPSTKYHVRAYALRGLEYYYGEDKSFTTLGNGGGGGLGNHSYVDLGLPSGTLWATCNVGATTPEEYGNYYAWGETEPKSVYDWDNYKYCNGHSNQLTKYCTQSQYGYNGFTDNLTVLQPSDDAATANWGSGWCIPTKEQWEELYQNTATIWTTQNNVKGCRFTGLNGNSIFLPATGIIYSSMPEDVGDDGEYLSSSLCATSRSYYAWWFLFQCYNGLEVRMMDDGPSRSDGFTVRPVRSAQ